MSGVEYVVQPFIHDRPMSRQLPCNRCFAVIEYNRGTEWCIINDLVNEHWKACPGKPHARTARALARTPTSPSDTPIASSPPMATLTPGSALRLRNGAEPVHFPNSHPNPGHTWVSVAECGRKRRTLEQRKLELEQDMYTEDVTNKSVVCVGCRKEISLDKRSNYYPGLWLKHRGKCPGIEKLERAKVALNAPQESEEPSDDVVTIPLSGNKGREGGALWLGATATLRLVRQNDPDTPLSDDSDEDTEETFPTLNRDFYRRQYNHSDAEWTYRYATKDEITANLFRGQNESYTCLGSRQGQGLGAHLDPQEGNQAVPRCVISNRVELEVVSLPRLVESSLRSTQELEEAVAPHTLCLHANTCMP